MVRTQIQLTEQQAAQVREMAEQQGVSMAEVVRRAVDEAIGNRLKPSRSELMRRAERIFGKFRDIEGKTDVAERHDDYLDEAMSEEIERWHRTADQ